MATPKQTHILAIDCETTGLCFKSDSPVYNSNKTEHHQALSWGIIVADADTLESVEELYVEIKWNEKSLQQRDRDPSFGTYAENIHGLTIDHLEANGVTEEEALVQIANLIHDVWDTKPIIPLGHNVATFDTLFLKDLFHRHDLPLNINNRQIDTFSLGYVNWLCDSSDELFKTISGETRSTHNALDDIRLTLEAARTTRLLFQQLLKG